MSVPASEQVSYMDFLRGEIWMAGAKGGGYAESNRLKGALRLARGLLPDIEVERHADGSYINVYLFQVPTRSCSEAQLWAFGLEYQYGEHGRRLAFLHGPE